MSGSWSGSSRSLEFLIPGDLQAATGGYAYDRRIAEQLVGLGWRVRLHALDASFPLPTVAALAHARDTLQRLDDHALVLIDGLALGAMPAVVAEQASRLRLVGLVHHPLAAETGLADAAAETLRRSERSALATLQAVVVTSRRTLRDLAGYGVAVERMSVVEPGTDPPAVRMTAAADSAASADTSVLRLLCVATLVPRKGHRLLLQALAALREMHWTLDCVGSTTRNAVEAQAIALLISTLRLTDRVRCRGELDADALAMAYRDADVFVLATHHEGYGMAVGEAIANGLPVVSTRVGAIPTIVGETAGLLVPPGDAAALTAALSTVISNPARRAELAQGARQRAATLPTWAEAGRQFDAALRRL